MNVKLERLSIHELAALAEELIDAVQWRRRHVVTGPGWRPLAEIEGELQIVHDELEKRQ